MNQSEKSPQVLAESIYASGLPESHKLKLVNDKFVVCYLPERIAQSTVENGQEHSCIFVCLEMARCMDRKLRDPDDIFSFSIQMKWLLESENLSEGIAWKLPKEFLEILEKGIDSGNQYAHGWIQIEENRAAISERIFPIVPDVIRFINAQNFFISVDEPPAEVKSGTVMRPKDQIHFIEMKRGTTKDGEEVSQWIKKACCSNSLKQDGVVYLILIAVKRAVLVAYQRSMNHLILFDPHKRQFEPLGAVIAFAKFEHLKEFCCWILTDILRVGYFSEYNVDCIQIHSKTTNEVFVRSNTTILAKASSIASTSFASARTSFIRIWDAVSRTPSQAKETAPPPSHVFDALEASSSKVDRHQRAEQTVKLELSLSELYPKPKGSRSPGGIVLSTRFRSITNYIGGLFSKKKFSPSSALLRRKVSKDNDSVFGDLDDFFFG